MEFLGIVHCNKLFSPWWCVVATQSPVSSTTNPVAMETEQQSIDTQPMVTTSSKNMKVNMLPRTSLDQPTQPVVVMSSTVKSISPSVTMDSNPPEIPLIGQSCDPTSRGSSTPGDQTSTNNMKYNIIPSTLVQPVSLGICKIAKVAFICSWPLYDCYSVPCALLKQSALLI